MTGHKSWQRFRELEGVLPLSRLKVLWEDLSEDERQLVKLDNHMNLSAWHLVYENGFQRNEREAIRKAILAGVFKTLRHADRKCTLGPYNRVRRYVGLPEIQTPISKLQSLKNLATWGKEVAQVLATGETVTIKPSSILGQAGIKALAAFKR